METVVHYQRTTTDYSICGKILILEDRGSRNLERVTCSACLERLIAEYQGRIAEIEARMVAIASERSRRISAELQAHREREREVARVNAQLDKILRGEA